MSDPIQRLEQKIDSSNEKVDKLVETMTTFIAFQARAEERHSSTKERLDKLEEQHEKLVDKVETLSNMVTKNSLIINGAVGIGGLVGGSIVTWLLSH